MPLVSFLIGGVQKGGTTALARYLGRHPQLALPRAKEAHVFDAPDFDERWTPAQIDRRYAAHFEPGGPPRRLYGDATPIYLFHPALIARIARYNPGMRWIVLLRHPADRAISHYHMERGRGAETLPLAAALLAEPWRLRGHADDFAWSSPLRCHSYLARGRYARQLDALFAAFPSGQVLLLPSDALLHRPAIALARVHRFLGLEPADEQPPFERVFAGGYRLDRSTRLVRRALAWYFRRELAALERRHGIRL